MRWYKISDRSLRIREGVLFVREMTTTFANIQNISISQGPIQRFFKISDLKVETAGGGGSNDANNGQNNMSSMHIGFFRGVSNSEQIRELMLNRLKQLKSTGIGDLDEDTTEQSTNYNDNLITAVKKFKNEATLLRQVAEQQALK